jgi:hypothetical protein
LAAVQRASALHGSNHWVYMGLGQHRVRGGILRVQLNGALK